MGHLPLNALRAFEASARHLSFTKAGLELRVGQAAVSHQIKGLEALLGVQLNHGGNTSKPTISGFQPVAPSPVPSAFAGGHVPDALDEDDIALLVEAYADAAERSVAAGADISAR